MESEDDKTRDLKKQVDELKNQLCETKGALNAIQSGGVDAVVVYHGGKPQVYLLTGADEPYRVMVENMREGALVLQEESRTIVYCNQQMVTMLGATSQSLLGSSFYDFLAAQSRITFDAAMQNLEQQTEPLEVALQTITGSPLPAQLTFGRLHSEEPARVSVIVTDLSEQKRRYQEIVALEAFSSAIIEQAMDGIVVCNNEGRIIRANQAAHHLAGMNPISEEFGKVYPLFFSVDPFHDPQDRIQEQAPSCFSLEKVSLPIQGIEVNFKGKNDQRVDLLLSASKLLGPGGSDLGVLYTMTDISQRQKAIILQQAKDAAEAASEEKNKFLAVISHDLRTPLNAIIGFSELTLLDWNDELMGSRRKENIERVASAGRHILALVEGLLSISSIEAGKVDLKREVFDLEDLLSQLIKSYELLAEKKSISLHGDIHVQRAVFADRDRIRQVINNLVNNALKYTPPMGTITIGASESEREMTIFVKDTGAGIDKEDLERIFIPFQQGKDAIQEPKDKSVGLGLAISRQLVELHGGKISVQSIKGEGSCFSFTLPFERHEVSVAAPETGEITAGQSQPALNRKSPESGTLPRAL
jgi:PAS domain S-box-containing protein